jgi:PAS domain S-box-containing protein
LLSERYNFPYGRYSEYRFLGKDGIYRWWANQLIITNDENGKLLYRDGFVRDITERKKAEEALKETEERFKAIADNTPDHIIVQDSSLRYTFVVNPQIGLTEKDMLGKTDFDILDKEDAEKLAQIKSRVISTGKPFHVETSLVGKEGKLEFFSGSYVPKFNREGHVDGLIGYFQNVTARKKSEEALEKARFVLSEGQRIAHVGTFEYIAENQTTVWSDEECRIYGLEPGTPSPAYDEMLAKFVHPDDVALLHETFSKAIQSGSIYELEHRILRPDGGVRVVYDLAHPYFDEKGNLTRYIGTTLDLTEQKRVAAELESVGAQRKLALDTAHMGWFRFDPIKNYSWWDDRYKEIFGFTEYEKPNDEILASRLDPEDLPGVWTKVQASLDPSNPQPYDAEYRINLPDGSMKWIEAHGIAVFDGNGKDKRATSLIGTVMDITERKKAEGTLHEALDYLDNLFNYANAPIIVWNPELRITRFNHAFEHLTGRLASEVIGKSLDILFPEDGKEHSLEHIKKAMTGQRMEVEEIPIQHKDGSASIVIWNSATLYTADGKTQVATIAQGQDITDRKAAEEDLRQRTAELEAANKELETFSYSVSHDLRAPLRTLDGFSEMVLEDYGDKLDEAGKDYLNRIRNASHTMSELIEAILKLSRISRAEIHGEKVNLSNITKSIADGLKQSQPLRQAEFIIEPDLIVKGDAALLRIALNNMLENAWKYTSKCSPTRIEFGINEKKGEKVYFIKDNGIGFDMQYKEKLFQPFQRLHTGNEYPGTGIGLATVQRVIKRHNGRIWAESEIGTGTTFYFTLE